MTRIRKAVPEDTTRIAPLWIASMLFHEKYSVIYHTAPDFRNHVEGELKELLEKPHVAFFIVEKDADVVGFSMTTVSDRPKALAKAKRGYIGYTWVDESVRGQGIGSAIVAEIMKWFKNQGVDIIDLLVTKQNELAMQFWEKNGFETVNYYMVKEMDL